MTRHGGCAILFNKDTFHPNIDVKSIYLHDTRRALPDQVMEGDQGWVLQGVVSRASFRRPPLSGQKTCTVLSLHISNIYVQKTVCCKKNSSAQSEPSCLANRLTCLQAISMEQLGDVAPVTISVLLMKALLIVPCQRHLAQHHCGDQVRFQIAGPARVRHRLHGAFSITPKLSACVLPIKAAIMRDGSTWISSIGAAPNHITGNLTDEFSSRNVRRYVLQQAIMGSRKDVSVKSCFVPVRPFARVRNSHANMYILTK